MVQLHSLNLVKGFVVGIEYEYLEDNEYIIISLGLLEIIFIF